VAEAALFRELRILSATVRFGHNAYAEIHGSFLLVSRIRTLWQCRLASTALSPARSLSPGFLFYDTLGCGSSIHALWSNAVKSDETSISLLDKIGENHDP
jgi:hypothetical protein